jgi:hypothetical protein
MRLRFAPLSVVAFAALDTVESVKRYSSFGDAKFLPVKELRLPQSVQRPPRQAGDQHAPAAWIETPRTLCSYSGAIAEQLRIRSQDRGWTI